MLTITEAQPEQEKVKSGINIWHCLPGNDGPDPVKPALPEDLEVYDGTAKERPLTTSEHVTEQAKDPYCRELASIVG